MLDDLLREGAAGGGIGTEWVGRKAWLRLEEAERSGSVGDDLTGSAVPEGEEDRVVVAERCRRSELRIERGIAVGADFALAELEVGLC